MSKKTASRDQRASHDQELERCFCQKGIVMAEEEIADEENNALDKESSVYVKPRKKAKTQEQHLAEEVARLSAQATILYDQSFLLHQQASGLNVQARSLDQQAGDMFVMADLSVAEVDRLRIEVDRFHAEAEVVRQQVDELHFQAHSLHLQASRLYQKVVGLQIEATDLQVEASERQKNAALIENGASTGNELSIKQGLSAEAWQAHGGVLRVYAEINRLFTEAAVVMMEVNHLHLDATLLYARADRKRSEASEQDRQASVQHVASVEHHRDMGHWIGQVERLHWEADRRREEADFWRERSEQSRREAEAMRFAADTLSNSR